MPAANPSPLAAGVIIVKMPFHGIKAFRLSLCNRPACTARAANGTVRSRLARLAACYGPEIELAELVRKLSSDCHHRRENHPYRQGCQARLLDWPRNRPPDELLATFAVVKGGKS